MVRRRSFLTTLGALGVPLGLTGTSAVSGETGPGNGAALVSWIRRRTGAVARTVADVFDDRPSVMDFIPAGERVKVREGSSRADLSPFFRAAAAADLPLVVPSGVYRLKGDVRFSRRVRFMAGAALHRDGGKLAFDGGIDAHPGQQVFVGYDYPAITVDNRNTPEGWVDWFGQGADAIETCHRNFLVSRLGPRDYVVDRSVVLDRSNRQVLGACGSAEGAGGTRIVLTGPAAADRPVVQVGTLERGAVLSCARRLVIKGINTVRDGLAQPAASGRREDAVPGWNIAGWYEGRIEDCFDYGSPIHFRVDATVSCALLRCSGVRPRPGAASGHPDFYTAFCIGGHAANFGFVGANASLTIESCGTAGGAAGDASRVGLYLFGFIGDTWIERFEMSQLEYGIYVDGSDRSGKALASLTAHQDVRVNNCVLDAVLRNCLTLRRLNEGCGVQARGNYGALNGAGDGILIEDCTGPVTIDGGDLIANSALDNCGVHIVGSKRVQVISLPCRDFRVGLRAETSSQLRLTPTLHRVATGGTNAVELNGVARAFVAPIVDGVPGAWQGGISVDARSTNTEVNLTAINTDALAGRRPDRKLLFRQALVTQDRFGAGNIRSGVVT